MRSTSAEAIFAKYNHVAKNGGVFVPGNSDFPSLALFYEFYHGCAIASINAMTKQLTPGKPTPWIHFDFVNNTQLDAMAFKSEDQYFIAVNMGTPLLLFDLFNRMLSYSEVLPHIGNPAAELIDPPLISKLYSDADFIEQVVEDGVIRHAFVIPKDPVRAEFATVLTWLAMDFLVSHELGHVLRGHLSLSEQDSGLPLISEAGWHASQSETPLLQQALEWDADYHATQAELHMLRSYCDHPYRLPLLWRPFFASYFTSLYTWFFATNSLFRLMGVGEYQIEKLPSITHLPPRVRQSTVSDMVRLDLVKNTPHLLQRFDELMCVFERTGLNFKGMGLCASLDVERIITDLTATDKLDTTGLKEATEEEFNAHFDSVKSELNRIRPRLREIMKLMGVVVA